MAKDTITIKELQKELTNLQQPFFADRKNITEAYKYMNGIISTFKQEERVAILTGVHVLLNTVSKQIIGRLNNVKVEG